MKKRFLDKFGNAGSEDSLQLLYGRLLGKGIYREVYDMAMDPRRVLKVEYKTRTFSNVTEWEIWNNLPKKWKDWFAPCHYISPCGIVLVQSKVKFTTELPVRIPSFMTDTKRLNWGELPNGRVVCCDYGNHKLFNHGFNTGRMVKAKWWD